MKIGKIAKGASKGCDTLGIMVERMASVPSHGEYPSNVDKGRSNSYKVVYPLARSMSKEPISKLLDFGTAGENPIVLSIEIPCGS